MSLIHFGTFFRVRVDFLILVVLWFLLGFKDGECLLI